MWAWKKIHVSDNRKEQSEDQLMSGADPPTILASQLNIWYYCRQTPQAIIIYSVIFLSATNIETISPMPYWVHEWSGFMTSPLLSLTNTLHHSETQKDFTTNTAWGVCLEFNCSIIINIGNRWDLTKDNTIWNGYCMKIWAHLYIQTEELKRWNIGSWKINEQPQYLKWCVVEERVQSRELCLIKQA